MDFKLTLNNQGVLYDATKLCEGDITLESSRRDSPGKLTFNLIKHESLSFFEGNEVTFSVGGVNMFLGYVFKKSRTQEQIISVTAYDQIRYLKNKETYVYEKKKASEIIKMVANDYKLSVGAISDTGYVIPKRSEDMQTLMDIIYNALDLTVINTGNMFVLYDDFGKLCCKSIKQMQVNAVLSSNAEMAGYSYQTDIDTETYNRVKLVQDDKEAKTRESYVIYDSANMKKWGLLQLHEKVDEKLTKEQIIARANQLLKNHNRVKQSLSIDNLGGDLNIRGGCSLFVDIPDLGEISLKKLMVIEKCVHTFRNNEHTMQLTMGGSF